jgi:hypothetical protein
VHWNIIRAPRPGPGKELDMSELDDFRTKTLSRFAEAEIALHN